MRIAHAIAILLATTSTVPDRGIVADGRVDRVIDGDTFVMTVETQVKVRLINCWSPEVSRGPESEREKGRAARDHLQTLLPAGSRVRIQIPTTGRLQDSLSLDRALAHAWRDSNSDGDPDSSIAEEQIAAGHATRFR